ncbi:MAG: TIGR01777 family oxidoreductase [Thermoanaerobaculia bacterium]|nr:TIGR01777 family oxidoreductase [Thermoanaerobaculia bacterium]
MRVAVSGASGLVGSALLDSLRRDGHEAIPMIRAGSENSADTAEGFAWDVEEGRLDPEDLRGLDAIVHLAGENIASGRWSEARKQRIRNSRVRGTRLIAESLAALGEPPPVFVSASAIGFYGDRGDDWLTEQSLLGEGFLADVCWRWEAAAEAARQAGVRVVHPRFGLIVSGRGGALARMLRPFKLGAGGILGKGAQWMSWIHLEDAVGAIRHLLVTEGLKGPVNIVSENPVTNREFTKTLGRVLSRPTILPMPMAMVRAAFGEMGDELLLASTRVDGSLLRRSGFVLRFPDLESAFRSEV